MSNADSSSRPSSPTIVIVAGSSPSRTSSRARNGPLRSVRSPRTSSLPVMTSALRRREDAARGDDEHLRLAAGIGHAPAVHDDAQVAGRAGVDAQQLERDEYRRR